jgi:futalosine hydrolase
MRLLLVTAVEAEARAIEPQRGLVIVVAGVGRTNAACATTETLVERPDIDAVLSVGVAGALPGGDLAVGDVLVASSCLYAEEGLLTAHGFAPMSSIGFDLGDFEGNAVPVDPKLLDVLADRFRIGPVATVATCSGTDAAAAEIARRTDALAEAMEGAAVVHAARRRGVPAIELRAISNHTGDRSQQQWDLERGLASLGVAVRDAVELIRSSGLYG